MLARNAESLYWIGRYVERADDTARILDVSVHQLLEDATVNPDATSRQLLAVLGIEPPNGESLDVWSLTELVAYSGDHAGSIVSSVNSARENTRGAREVVSTEMWECLNAMWNAVPERQRYARMMGPHAFFSFVEERAAMFAGLADSTMSRDDGWLFLILGRSLERVDMTARLLSASFGDRSVPVDLVSTLRCCSAHEAFLRTYRRRVEPDLVAEFLLLDRLFPRSAFHALGQAEECLAELQPGASRSGLDDEARRILGRARTELEFRRVHELIADLPAYLCSLQAACSEAGDAVARRFFRQSAPLEWSLEVVGGRQ
jgi:uncharacterized alpha-E superfamily protein